MVSCLKLEPKVSSFPVLEATLASSTNATAKSQFIWTYVYESTVNEIGLCLVVVKDASSLAVASLIAKSRA